MKGLRFICFAINASPIIDAIYMSKFEGKNALDSCSHVNAGCTPSSAGNLHFQFAPLLLSFDKAQHKWQARSVISI